MTLDHFGRPISNYLYQCFGFFSAAEGFFFLSGFVGALAAFSKGQKDPSQSWMRARALKIWKYHIVTLLVLSLAAWGVLHSISIFFTSVIEHPITGSLLSIVLINTPDYLDVLPLYVIFLLAASWLFPLMIRNKKTTFKCWLISLFIWAAAQFGLRHVLNGTLPGWVHHGFFDPLAWQFIYMTGAAIAICWKRNSTEGDTGIFTRQFFARFDRFMPTIAGMLLFFFLWHHQFIAISIPDNFWIGKANVGILRFANFMGFVALVSWIVRHFPSALDFRITNVIGRHSLDVFSVHIVLVYLWLATPNSIRYHAPWNLIAPIAACVLLWAIAKLREPKPPRC